MAKFFVTKIADTDPVFETVEAATDAAKASSQLEPGAKFFVCEEEYAVVTPLPEPVVTKVE